VAFFPLFFSPSPSVVGCFARFFLIALFFGLWAFRNKGSKKNAIKKTFSEFFRCRQKEYLLTSFFLTAPLARQQRGAAEKKKTKSQCTYVLYLARIELFYTCDAVIFFIAFLSSPYRKTPKNALKKNR
jgi:hypothetical protein